MKSLHVSLMCAIAGIGLLAGPALAEEPTPASQQRIEFHQLVRQRNTLHQQLVSADQQALRSIKDGRKPVSLHAQQTNLQDQLDLVSLRLEMLALRIGEAVPPLPTEKTPEEFRQSQLDRLSRGWSRGRDRALEELRQETLQMLRSLDFSMFDDGISGDAATEPDRGTRPIQPTQKPTTERTTSCSGTTCTLAAR